MLTSPHQLAAIFTIALTLTTVSASCNGDPPCHGGRASHHDKVVLYSARPIPSTSTGSTSGDPTLQQLSTPHCADADNVGIAAGALLGASGASDAVADTSNPEAKHLRLPLSNGGRLHLTSFSSGQAYDAISSASVPPPSAGVDDPAAAAADKSAAAPENNNMELGAAAFVTPAVDISSAIRNSSSGSGEGHCIGPCSFGEGVTTACILCCAALIESERLRAGITCGLFHHIAFRICSCLSSCRAAPESDNSRTHLNIAPICRSWQRHCCWRLGQATGRPVHRWLPRRRLPERSRPGL